MENSIEVEPKQFGVLTDFSNFLVDLERKFGEIDSFSIAIQLFHDLWVEKGWCLTN
jgi:hypothetical protein